MKYLVLVIFHIWAQQPPPSLFLIEFWRITRSIFFQHGGDRPSLPPSWHFWLDGNARVLRLFLAEAKGFPLTVDEMLEKKGSKTLILPKKGSKTLKLLEKDLAENYRESQSWKYYRFKVPVAWSLAQHRWKLDLQVRQTEESCSCGGVKNEIALGSGANNKQKGC